MKLSINFLTAALALTCGFATAQPLLKPQASVLNVFAFGDQPARAELLVDARVVSVHVGDEIQGWRVSGITRKDVVVSRDVVQTDPLRQKGAAIGASQKARESNAWFAPAPRAGGGLVSFTETHVLPRAIEAGSAGATRGPAAPISIQ